MSHSPIRRHDFRPKNLDHRTLRLERLEPRQLLAANFLGMIDSAMASYVRSLYSDGSISRNDTIAILRRVQNESDGVVDATDLSDLRTIVRNATTLRMPDSSRVLADNVVNSNLANAHYQGAALGNLVVGNANAKLGKLTDKWFYGTDLPSTGGYAYATTSGSLYTSAGPSHYDERQGYLGDCYLIAGLGSVADSSKTAIKNMFIGNGDGTWTVRFFYNGRADYVTVNRKLPINSDYLIFAGSGSKYWNSTNTLWMPLLEKAYVQWNETGRTWRGVYTNSYSDIEGGWMGDVYQQVLGYSTVYSMPTSYSGARSTMINALANHQAVTLGTIYSPNFGTTGLYGNHAYNVLSYNSSTGKFTLYNPWGSNQPKQLNWTQLAANCDWFANTVTTRTTAARIALNRSVFGSPEALPAVAMTTRLDTFEASPAVSQVSTLSAPAADMVLTAWDGSLKTSTTLRSGDWWWSDTPAKRAAGPSNDVFTDIDSLFESIHSHAALAL